MGTAIRTLARASSWICFSLVFIASSAQAAAPPSMMTRALAGSVAESDGVIVKFKESTHGTAQSTSSSAPAVTSLGAKAQAARMTKHLSSPARAAMKAVGARAVAGLPRLGQLVLKTDQPASRAIDALYRSGTVEYAVPNFRRRAQSRYPSDEFFAMQWALEDVGQVLGPMGADPYGPGIAGFGDRDIDAPQAWDIRTDASDVVVAIIDSGVDYEHPDLAANMWRRPGEIASNGVDDDGNGYIDDVYGIDLVNDDSDPLDDAFHGTEVAGLIGGVGDNAFGIAGVAWKAQLMTIKAVHWDGSISDADAIAAIEYVIRTKEALALPRVVINMSWGGPQPSPALRDAVAAARDAGILVIAAAGSDGTDNDAAPFYPASFDLDNVVSVSGSSNAFEGRSGRNNFGCGSVDLMAPAVDLATTYPHLYGIDPPFVYAAPVGSSLAAGLVSGTAALAWAEHPEGSWADVKSALLRSVQKFPDLARLSVTQGIVRAPGALSSPVGAPAIWSVQSVTVPPGLSTKLRGYRFGDSAGQVYFRNWDTNTELQLQVVSWTDAEILVQVPSAATFGPGEIYLKTAAQIASNGACFSIGTAATVAGELSMPRIAPAYAQVGNSLWLFGGNTYYGLTSTAERYELDTGRTTIDTRWTLPQPVAASGAAAISKKIYVVGGVDFDQFQGTDAVQIFDTTNDSWSAGAPLPAALAYGAVTSAGPLLYVFGGIRQLAENPTKEDYLATTFIYEHAKNQWREGAPLPLAVWSASAIADPVSGLIRVLGGYAYDAETGGQIPVSNVWTYDPRTDSWTAGPSMRSPRAEFGALRLDTAIYAINGTGDSINHARTNWATVERLEGNEWATAISGTARLSGVAVGRWRAQGFVAGGAITMPHFVNPAASQNIWTFQMPLSAQPSPPPNNPPPAQSSGGGGGTFGWGMLLALLATAVGRGWSRMSASAFLLTLLAAVMVPMLAVAQQRKLLAPTGAAVRTAAPDRIIVKYKDPSARRAASRALVLGNARKQGSWMVTQLSTEARSAITAAGAKVIKGNARLGQLVLRTDQPLAKAIDALMRSGTVEYAVPDYRRRAFNRYPDDEHFARLWALEDVGQLVGFPDEERPGLGDRDINAPEAWDVRTDASSVLVAVVDTGIEYTHPDLAANMWMNPDEIPENGIDDDSNGYVDDVYGIDIANGDSDPMDDNFHGTHVAGTIGAVGDNAIGVTGVAWTAKLMAVKFLGLEGSGADSDAIEAIEYVIRTKERLGLARVVINASWGGGGFSPPLRDAIAAARDAGILFMAAAGNDARNTDDAPNYPSGYELDNIVSVGAAATSREGRAGFSNYGCGSVDVFAPGVDILSTTPGANYEYSSGTSMATPVVAGVAALFWAQSPNATWMDVREALLHGSDRRADLNQMAVSQGLVRADQVLGVRPGLPSLWSATPLMVSPGGDVVLRGRALGSAKGSARFRGQGVDADTPLEVLSWDASEVTVRVPRSAPYGYGEIILESADGAASNGICFALADRPSQIGTLALGRNGPAYAQIGDKLWVIGGHVDQVGPTALVERYDLAQEHSLLDSQWIMPRLLGALSAAAIGEKIYVPGGMDMTVQGTETTPEPVLQIFDTRSGTWSEGAPLPEGLSWVATAADNTKLYVFGGFRKYLPRSSAEISEKTHIYDPVGRQWTEGAALPYPVAYASAIHDPASGKIFVLGGQHVDPATDGTIDLPVPQAMRLVQIYDSKSNSWSFGPDMQHPRYGMGVLVHKDLIYALHGLGNMQTGSGWSDGEFLANGSWVRAMVSPHDLWNPAVGKWGSHAYVLGGYSQVDLASPMLAWKFELPDRPEPEPPAPPPSSNPQPTEPVPPPDPLPPRSGGGGSLDWMVIALLTVSLCFRRRRR